MASHANFSIDGLCRECDGSLLIVRPPGASQTTIPPDKHFLDVYLGKSDAAYEVSGFEGFGSTSPPSTFVFLPAGQERLIRALRAGWSIQIFFRPDMLYAGNVQPEQPFVSDPDQNKVFPIAHCEDEMMRVIANQLYGVWRTDLPCPSSSQIEAVNTLLIMRVGHHALYGNVRPPRASSISKRVQQVIDRIESDLSAPHTIGDLADIAGVSTHHFARMFRQATGRSPHRYLIERRLAQAKRRLCMSDDPIVEIALDCGFGSQSHMTDVFSRILKTTPGAVRRAME